MLGNTQPIQLPSASTPAPLCSSPTKGFHPCVYCGHSTARVAFHKWKQHHPPGTNVYGLPPNEHPKAQSDKLDWRLLCWLCEDCAQMWCSYKYYVAVEECPPCSNDFNPLPTSIFKALPATPSTEGEVSLSDGTSSYSDMPYPTRSSSRAWSSSQSTNSALGQTFIDPLMLQDTSLAMDFDMVPIPAASAAASAALSGNCPDVSFFDTHHVKHFSAPAILPEQLNQLDDALLKRWSEPFGLGQASQSPDMLNSDRAKAYKRGEKFDPLNYIHMRKFGACQDCRNKRRKCHPSHPRMEIQSSPGPQ